MTAASGAPILAAMERNDLVLELHLELDAADSDTAAGWLRPPTGPPRRFEGYVQLISALHELQQDALLAGRAS
jgi:hypothetical protein